MKNFTRAGLIITIVLGFLVGCEGDETTPELDHPLAGEYTLYEMVIMVESTTLRDTVLAFTSSQNGQDSVTIAAGTMIKVESDVYTNTDTDPIGGTVVLRNDMSGTLSGNLPVNWGSGCAPNILISTLTSDGSWSADTTTGVFTLDLVVDALDIDGSFSIMDDHLEVIYASILNNDQRMVSSINYQGSDVPVIPACLPVSTDTERILKLTIN